MFNVRVHVTGLNEAQMRLVTLDESFMDFSSALAILGDLLKSFYQDTVFVSEGNALLNRPWTPLKQATINQKNRLWPGSGMLQRGDGTMRHGFKSTVTPLTLEIYNDTPYFPYHQKGTGEKGEGEVPGVGRGKNLPPRPMLGINEEVVGMIQKTIEEDVRAKIDRSAI